MIKTITFAICHFTVAFSVAYLLTGSFGPTTSTKKYGIASAPVAAKPRTRLPPAMAACCTGIKRRSRRC